MSLSMTLGGSMPSTLPSLTVGTLEVTGAATFASTVTATTSITTPQVIGTLPNGLTLLAEAGGAYWVLDTAGVWKPGLDNTYDIGTGSKQVRDIYAARYVFAGYFVAAGAGAYLFNGRGGVRSSADGVLRLSNDADSDFARLCFGGTTSAFPALRRAGTNIEAVKADESAYAAFRGTAFLDANNVQVLGTRGAAVADATGAGDIVAQFNTLLARLRATGGHGLIAD